MHHPRWSSGLHGSDGTMSELWRLLASARADVVLAGHDHHYERFAPIDGIRSFVVGTGGKSHYPVLRRLPSSRAYDWTTFGVLRLELRADGYVAFPTRGGPHLRRLGHRPLPLTAMIRRPCDWALAL